LNGFSRTHFKLNVVEEANSLHILRQDNDDGYLMTFGAVGVRFRPPLINFANLEIFNFAARRNKPSL